MSHLNGLNGIATCFDELSQTHSTNLTSLLYSLAEGKQKDRSTKEGALILDSQKIITWSGAQHLRCYIIATASS